MIRAFYFLCAVLVCTFLYCAVVLAVFNLNLFDVLQLFLGGWRVKG